MKRLVSVTSNTGRIGKDIGLCSRHAGRARAAPEQFCWIARENSLIQRSSMAGAQLSSAAESNLVAIENALIEVDR